MNSQELRAVEETAKEITQTNGHDWDKEIVDLAFAYQAQAKLLDEACKALVMITKVMGLPCSENTCPGCQYEMEKTLEITRETLKKLNKEIT